jgi:hypothetical protein
MKTIHELTTNKDRKFGQDGKDPYYQILAHQKINWRKFLAEFVKRYLMKNLEVAPITADPSCLIFDDTDLTKTGKTIEGISKIHNHVSKNF